jgi:tetratricopeptide (TPR) repeat protein
MESSGSLRHLAFFEELAKLDETDPNWRSVSAGLVVMRLVDDWISDGASAVQADAWSVNAVREAVDEVPEANPLRRILLAILDCISSAPTVDIHALAPRLMAYAQSLEYEARWSLAADIYETVVAHTDPVGDADLVVSAFLQLAGCRRMVADVNGAALAYNAASSVAQAAGDMIGVLRGRIGDAKIALARGNMPLADEILKEAEQRAEVAHLDDVRARAIHERAIVAGRSGKHDRAVQLAYQALGVAPNVPDRDRILNNIATGLRFLGLHHSARDAYLVLAVTTQEQYVRWLAELNLMELSAIQGMGLQFDRHRRELESADFAPDLRVTYLLHVGRGYHSLGSPETGIPYLERAIKIASDHKLNQLVFECEAALADARKRVVRKADTASTVVPFEMQNVVDGLQNMRELAGIA